MLKAASLTSAASGVKVRDGPEEGSGAGGLGDA